jgi:hypothetical protein
MAGAEGEYDGQEVDALFPVFADLPSSLTGHGGGGGGGLLI